MRFIPLLKLMSETTDTLYEEGYKRYIAAVETARKYNVMESHERIERARLQLDILFNLSNAFKSFNHKHKEEAN